MGQPTHAFDLDKIEGGIVVRRARKGEKLKTLDGVERTLDPEDLVVADHAKPLGLAGVMGGWDTMITPATKNVLVEAAWFDPMAVRRTARRHGLHTDASHRFERGADFNAAPLASAIVSQHSARQRRTHRRRSRRRPRSRHRGPHRAAASPSRSRSVKSIAILGTTVDKEGITAAAVEDVLTALGCALSDRRRSTPHGKSRCPAGVSISSARSTSSKKSRASTVTTASPTRCPPSAKASARCPGPKPNPPCAAPCSPPASTKPSPAPSAPRPKPRSPRRSRAWSSRSATRSAKKPAFCAPRSSPACLPLIAGNLHRDVSDVRLFELGTVFSGTTEKVEERPALAFGAAGSSARASPRSIAARAIDFHDVKGAVEQILARFQIAHRLLRPLPA